MRKKLHVRHLAVGIVVVVALVVLTVVVAAAQERGTPAGPVYPLATLYRNLQCCSQAWVGRTVLVRGKIALIGRLYIPPALTTYRVFMTLVPSTVNVARPNGGRPYTGPQLQATPQYRTSTYWTVLEWLRSVPWIGQWVPERQGQVGRTEVFRLTLLARHTACPIGRCADSPDALLLDVYA